MKKVSAILVVLALVVSAQAATYTWTGATSNVWSVSGNWASTDGTTYPQGTDMAVFAGDASVTTGALDAVPNMNIAGTLNFTTDSSWTRPNPLTTRTDVTITGTGGIVLNGWFKIQNNFAANTFAGGLDVRSGKASLGGSDQVIPASGLTLSGGNIQLLRDDPINNNAPITFNSTGTDWLQENNFSTFYASMGTAKLQHFGVITNYRGSELHFADSSAIDWSAGTMLNVEFLAGEVAGGIGSTYFGTNANGLTAAQLAKVQFVQLDNNYDATGVTFPAALDANGKLYMVPEPMTLSLLVVGGIGALLRRRSA